MFLGFTSAMIGIRVGLELVLNLDVLDFKTMNISFFTIEN